MSSLSKAYKNLLLYSKSGCVEELGFDDLLLPSARERLDLDAIGVCLIDVLCLEITPYSLR